MSGPPVLSVFIGGDPVSAPRPRAYRGAAGRAGVYMPQRYTQWKRSAALILRARWGHHEPIQTAVAVAVEVVIPRPQRRPSSGLGRMYWHPEEDYPAPVGGGWGDLDNYIKSALDALQDARIIRDDAQVVELTATKHAGTQPGLHITLSLVHPEAQ